MAAATVRKSAKTRAAKSAKREPWYAAASRLMKNYSERGAFRGQVDENLSGETVSYKMRWHRNREFRVELNRRTQLVRTPEVLPGIVAKSAMYREYAGFLASFQDGSREPHRSVEPKKAKIVPASRAGRVSLTLQVLDEDYEYALKKMLALIHETYLGFIMGPYDVYRVEQLGADPDWGR